MKTWRKRWFVLKNGSLNYWKSQHDVQRKPQGQIQLDEVCRINRAEGASTFEIDTGKKVYYLTADSHATMDDWIRVLQNVQRRNATKLLLSRDDQKPTVQGWVTKVKNGHPKKCWCVLLGKMFLYFKAPAETVSKHSIDMYICIYIYYLLYILLTSDRIPLAKSICEMPELRRLNTFLTLIPRSERTPHKIRLDSQLPSIQRTRDQLT